MDTDSIARIGPKLDRTTAPLFDYGKLYGSTEPYQCACPTTTAEVQAVLRYAAARQHPVRVRGSGHTFNGCTLPQPDEILLRTASLDEYRFDGRDTITVGAGALVWDVRDLVSEYAHQLPVYNGGWAGPSIGGYINAGGFGKGSLSQEHGGFWEHVLEVQVVDASGKLHHIARDDERFPWVFSAFGQLGVVVAATLRILPTGRGARLLYPRRRTGRVPRQQSDDPTDNDRPGKVDERVLFWFSLLLPKRQEAVAWEALRAFCERHPEAIVPEGGWAGPVLNAEPIGYRYEVRFHTFNPPLLYPYAEDFLVLGVMCRFDQDDLAERTRILALEQEFVDLALDNQLRLYLQAENIGRRVCYADYFGAAVWDEFRAIKDTFDPEHRINRGTVFDAPLNV